MAQNQRSKHQGNSGLQSTAQYLKPEHKAARSGFLPGLAGLLLISAASSGWAQSAVDDASAAPARASAPSVARSASNDCPPPPPIKVSANKGPVAWRDCADTPEMIRLKGGRFLMGEQGNTGTLYEQPVRTVRVAEFALGKYEVTFDEWDACHAARGCLRKVDDEGWGRGRRPVINVNWVDAQQYVAWLSRKTGQKYRLPTEAEWEYAARAGTSTRYSWGDSSVWVCSLANVFDRTGLALHPNWHWSSECDDGYATTAPVGTFKPSRWGFHDLSGNVWEWVQDCWHSDYTGAPADSRAWDTGPDCHKRVNRGGGWGNNPRSMRSASRDADEAESVSDALGFRVARSP